MSRWPLVLTGVGAALLVAVLLAGVVLAAVLGDRDGPDTTAGVWRPPAPLPAEPATASPTPTADDVISLSATGDIILGDAGSLPPNDGEGFFADVAEALAADLVMGNLEQPLTEDTGYEK